jgi:hypothetical protein
MMLAAGLAVSAAHVAMAQPYLVNISGATLLRNLFTTPASTNDFIEVNGDAFNTRVLPRPTATQLQLAPSPANAPWVDNYVVPGWWNVQYRSVGSVNGLQELVDWGGQRQETAYITAPQAGTNLTIGNFAIGDLNQLGMLWTAANPAIVNRRQFINSSGQVAGIFNSFNPGGTPIKHTSDGLFLATPHRVGVASSGVMQIHIAPIDVPAFWGATNPTVPVGQPDPASLWSRKPGVAGYGTNTNNSRNVQGGTSGANLSNRMVDVPSYMSFYDGVPANADENTIFDTRFTYAPIAPVGNFGIGRSQITYTEMQHVFVTGRLPSGENLVAVTRDAGSGTHNGFMNSVGIDPSWGSGENIGPVNQFLGSSRPGPSFVPGNKGSNLAVSNSVRNVRLGIGYLGGDIWAGDQGWRFADILTVVNDLGGRTGDPTRPTIDRILDNGLRGEANTGGPDDNVLTLPDGTNAVDGYRIGGLAVLSTFGDPLKISAANGGYGWPQSVGLPTILPGDVTPPATPAMQNPHAAEYVNNIKRSVDYFNAVPSDVSNVGSPGEFCAANFIPIPSVDYVPADSDGTLYIANVTRTDGLQSFERTNPLSVYITQATRFATWGSFTTVGIVPERYRPDATFPATTVYSDGVAAGSDPDFVAQNGTSLNQGDIMPNSRNRIAGDFDGDNARDLGDIEQMLRAWRQRNSPAPLDSNIGTNPQAWVDPIPGNNACIEILGDFSGDGNFGRVWIGQTSTVATPAEIANLANYRSDTIDVRYFLDGLLVVNGKVDRNAAFAEADTAWLAITGTDDNFFNTTKALGTYAIGDSRADIANSAGSTTRGHLPIGADGNDGVITAGVDNIINGVDVDYISTQINTTLDRQVDWANLDEASNADLSADVTGDLKIDCNDVNEVVTIILGTSIKDINLDGMVDGLDAAIATANLGTLPATWSRGDVTCDGVIDQNDVDFINGLPVCDDTDFNGDGIFPDNQDIIDFLDVFAGGACPTGNCNDIDFNNDGIFPDNNDIVVFLEVFAGGGCF